MTAQYPEHEKLQAIIASGARDTVQRFLDWLCEEFTPRGSSARGAWVATWREDPTDPWKPDYLSPVLESREQLLGLFFDIDPFVIDQEKRAMLAAIRERGGG